MQHYFIKNISNILVKCNSKDSHKIVHETIIYLFIYFFTNGNFVMPHYTHKTLALNNRLNVQML